MYCHLRLWPLPTIILFTPFFVCESSSQATFFDTQPFLWHGVSLIVCDEVLCEAYPVLDSRWLLSVQGAASIWCTDTVLETPSLSITTVCRCILMTGNGRTLRGRCLLQLVVAISWAVFRVLLGGGLSTRSGWLSTSIGLKCNFCHGRLWAALPFSAYEYWLWPAT